MPTNNRSRHEIRPRKAAIALGIMKIRKGTIGAGFVEPTGDTLEDLGADGAARDGGREEFPVRFGVEVAAVEGEAVALADGVVPVGLDPVDAVGDEAGGAVG